MNEILLIDKPADWTSFDVVAKLRNAISSKYQVAGSKRIKVGHAGTLDPFAKGLLIVLVGDATKKQNEFMKLDKEYETTLRLGFTSTTGDPEGTIEEIQNPNFKIPNKSELEKILKTFEGQIQQTPPAFSAIKIDGKRAYKLAREGKEVNIKPRTIILSSIEVLEYEWPKLVIRVKCSSGTYIRTLAEDIGKSLGTGAYLTALRRTKIGKYDVKNAKTIDKVMTI